MSPLFTIQRANTILYCRHWAETVRFYKELLGLPVIVENDWFIELQLTERSYLSIANAARTTIQDVAGQGVTLTWLVADLETAQTKLAALGVVTTPIKVKWRARVMYCRDPEGHRIELWEKGTSS